MGKTVSKIILITGTSSGIGLLSACRLGARGHIVYATMRDLSKQDRLLQEAARRQASVILRSLDVTKVETIQGVMEEIETEHGHLDVLINNAGYGLGGPFEVLAEAEIREIMETNFFGVQRMVRQALPLLRQTERSRIINLSSIAGLAGIPVLGAYSASKFALEGYSESLRHELRQFGVFVSLIEPGSFQTEIWTKNRRLAARYHDPETGYQTYAQRLLKSQEERYFLMSDPEQIAKLIERVVHARFPKMRYRVGWDADLVWMLRQILPFEWYGRLLHLLIDPPISISDPREKRARDPDQATDVNH